MPYVRPPQCDNTSSGFRPCPSEISSVPASHVLAMGRNKPKCKKCGKPAKGHVGPTGRGCSEGHEKHQPQIRPQPGPYTMSSEVGSLIDFSSDFPHHSQHPSARNDSAPPHPSVRFACSPTRPDGAQGLSWSRTSYPPPMLSYHQCAEARLPRLTAEITAPHTLRGPQSPVIVWDSLPHLGVQLYPFTDTETTLMDFVITSTVRNFGTSQ